MTLKTFQNHIEPKIINRGFAYFQAEAVTEIEQVAKGEFSATVEGSEEYAIFVKIDEDLTIVSHSCDCPYDWGNVCKHEVAVFYYLKKNKSYKEPLSQGAFHKIKEDLEGLNKQELIQLVLDMSKRSKAVRQEVKWELGHE